MQGWEEGDFRDDLSLVLSCIIVQLSWDQVVLFLQRGFP